MLHNAKTFRKCSSVEMLMQAVVIPIRKPSKDPSNPTSYRPIALTSNICKVMEQMITGRLTYELEKRGSCKSEFRKGRNTSNTARE